jgi:predicted nucleic acid-binding protein
VVPASEVIDQAAELAARLQIKGADSIHVAAAQTVQAEAGGNEFWFVSADLRQSAAARQEGMPVLDPTN